LEEVRPGSSFVFMPGPNSFAAWYIGTSPALAAEDLLKLTNNKQPSVFRREPRLYGSVCTNIYCGIDLTPTYIQDSRDVSIGDFFHQ
jgi:hypothetical protein